ncbi:E3 ubiquitin-protein ligase SH3RF3 [Galemys pyrenaicus]|uniref:E3 ubiquitin-protein ligase SH3RF3 n=1 Tax=Galemys pyrenaicus TaxID=202257 RepID=A0A8J6DK25_GALPY|nr:E3 ubiquitin-protein ligase SH3RF3 [Galemys pyrenaicus]
MLLGASWPCASRAAAAQSEGDDDESAGPRGRAAVAAASADADMDESSLLDLLECSVCLERLDTTAKVLPCQHTFCRRCLESIVCSRRELRCPECRILVGCGVDELPANILLVRLLDGIRQRPRAGASPGGSPPARPGPSSGGAAALAGGGGSAAGSAPGSPVFLPSAAGSATASLRELTTSRSSTVAKVMSAVSSSLHQKLPRKGGTVPSARAWLVPHPYAHKRWARATSRWQGPFGLPNCGTARVSSLTGVPAELVWISELIGTSTASNPIGTSQNWRGSHDLNSTGV